MILIITKDNITVNRQKWLIGHPYCIPRFCKGNQIKLLIWKSFEFESFKLNFITVEIVYSILNLYTKNAIEFLLGWS